MPKDADDALVSRAMEAYFRAGHGRQQLVTICRVRALAHNRYVVLSDINGVLAVYRIRGDGILRRMRRWSKELNE
jgi:hypothetical protein